IALVGLSIVATWIREMRLSHLRHLWVVIALGSIPFVLKYAHRKPKSQKPSFAITAPTAGNHQPELNIKSVVQHGHIVEIVADTEAGSIMMINGQQAAVVFGGHEARHFVGPLPPGVSNITVTVQKDDGSFNTQQVVVELP